MSKEANRSVIQVLEKSNRVLWACAHPDDENSCGSLIARAKDLAGSLHMVSYTRGENSDIVWAGLRRGSEIARAREELFAQSAQIFKADSHELGPFVNGPHTMEALDQMPPGPHQGWAPTTNSDEVLEKWSREGNPLDYTVGLLRRLRPDTVIAMDEWCGVSGHPEHIAVARLLLQAIPIAASGNSDESWQVGTTIFTAWVIQPLRDIGYKKCEGEEQTDPIEEVPSMDHSTRHGETYFRVSRRVAANYARVMRDQTWTHEDVESQIDKMESDGRQALEGGIRDVPLFEPVRVRSIRPAPTGSPG